MRRSEKPNISVRSRGVAPIGHTKYWYDKTGEKNMIGLKSNHIMMMAIAGEEYNSILVFLLAPFKKQGFVVI